MYLEMQYVVFYFHAQNDSKLLAKESDDDETVAHVGRLRDDLPEYGNDEIRRHD